MDNLKKAYELCKKKIDRHMERMSPDNVCEYRACTDGKYSEQGSDLNHMYNWTTSFITGLAPLMYRTEKEERYIIWANRFEHAYHEKIFEHSLETMHDIGFLYSPYSVAMYQLTGAEEHKRDALKAADELLKRFDINGRYIDAWSSMTDDSRQGRAIVDCMINIQLLFWAWKETGATIYRDVAKAHADTTIKYFLREDFSVCHSFDFDRTTGAVQRENNDCGYSNGSIWARGTAWMAYGLAMTARYLNDNTYYDTAVKVTDKYMECLGDKLMPVWDFMLPKDMPAFECGHKDNPEWDVTDPKNCELNIDTSAAAIMVCALTELNKIRFNEKYDKFAYNALMELCEKYLNKDENIMGMMSHQNGQMTYTTFGDYFFVQALQERIFNTNTCW